MKRLLKIISLIMAAVIVISICALAGCAYDADSYADFYFYDEGEWQYGAGTGIFGIYEDVEGEISVPNRIMGVKVSTIELRRVDKDGNEKECDKIITKVNIPANICDIFVDPLDYNPYFEVDKNNPYYSSEDGILFSKDKTEICSFPSFSDVRTYEIPDTVEIIKECAFRCNDTIESVIIPDNGCGFESEAFIDCHNLELIVPASSDLLEYSDWGSGFPVCNVKQINISEDNENYSSQDNVVFNKEKTEVLFYAGYDENGVDIVLPDTVKEIDAYAFADKNISSIVLPDSLEKMGDFSICGLNITELNIPVSLQSREMYDRWIAYNDSLETITVDEANENYTAEDGVLYNKDKTEIVLYPAAKKDASYTISENITYICDCAFSDLSGLKEIIVPENIPEAEEAAFGDNYNCTSSLEKVIYEGTLDEWMNYYELDYDWEVRGCSYYSRPLCSAGNLYIGGELLTDVVIDCKYVNTFALAGCTSLRSVTLTDNVEKIGHGAFYGCINLKTVSFGAGLESIGEVAFRKCYSLEEAMLNSELDYIGEEAFSYCTSLESTNLLDTSYNAFSDGEIDVFCGCTSLNDEVKTKYESLRKKNAFRRFMHSLFVSPLEESYGPIEAISTVLSGLNLKNVADEAYSAYYWYVKDHDYGYEHCDSEKHYLMSGGYGGGGAGSLFSHIINSIVKIARRKK